MAQAITNIIIIIMVHNQKEKDEKYVKLDCVNFIELNYVLYHKIYLDSY